MKHIKTDVLVCGGGCAGLGAALNSARNNAKTLLIERAGFAGGWPLPLGIGDGGQLDASDSDRDGHGTSCWNCCCDRSEIQDQRGIIERHGRSRSTRSTGGRTAHRILSGIQRSKATSCRSVSFTWVTAHRHKGDWDWSNDEYQEWMSCQQDDNQ